MLLRPAGLLAEAGGDAAARGLIETTARAPERARLLDWITGKNGVTIQALSQELDLSKNLEPGDEGGEADLVAVTSLWHRSRLRRGRDFLSRQAYLD